MDPPTQEAILRSLSLGCAITLTRLFWTSKSVSLLSSRSGKLFRHELPPETPVTPLTDDRRHDLSADVDVNLANDLVQLGLEILELRLLAEAVQNGFVLRVLLGRKEDLEQVQLSQRKVHRGPVGKFAAEGVFLEELRTQVAQRSHLFVDSRGRVPEIVAGSVYASVTRLPTRPACFA